VRSVIFFISARVTFRPFKVIQGHWIWHQSKARTGMRLPISPSVTLVLSCTVSEILQVLLCSWVLTPPLFLPIFGGVPILQQIAHVGVNMWACRCLNLPWNYFWRIPTCDHGSWTSRTDRQDGVQTT